MLMFPKREKESVSKRANVAFLPRARASLTTAIPWPASGVLVIRIRRRDDGPVVVVMRKNVGDALVVP